MDNAKLYESINGKKILGVLMKEKYIRFDLSDNTMLEIEIELPADCKMAVYTSEIRREKYLL